MEPEDRTTAKLVIVSPDEVTAVELSSLSVGSELKVASVSITVTGITDDRLLLDIDDIEWSLNRRWQVLSVCEPIELVCFVSTLSTSIDDQMGDTLEAMLADMRANADDGLLWCNIELARDMMMLLKDTRIEADAIDKAALCECVWSEQLLDESDVPRLLQSVVEYGHLSMNRTAAYSQSIVCEPDSEQSDWEAMRSRLATAVSPALSLEQRQKAFESTHRLKFDPVQLTPQWEDCIAQVEAEVDRRTAGTPRGMGFCYLYWSIKRDVLAAKGIKWLSPPLMNPGVLFD